MRMTMPKMTRAQAEAESAATLSKHQALIDRFNAARAAKEK
jgi:hypothetical protein